MKNPPGWKALALFRHEDVVVSTSARAAAAVVGTVHIAMLCCLYVFVRCTVFIVTVVYNIIHSSNHIFFPSH